MELSFDQLAAKVLGSGRMYQSLALAVLLGGAVATAPAAAGSGNFNVTATLQTTLSPTLCRDVNPPGAFGATVIVVCSTGATVNISPGTSGAPWSPVRGGANRYNFLPVGAASQKGSADSFVGAGTITSWRVVQMADWDYLEMLMSW